MQPSGSILQKPGTPSEITFPIRSFDADRTGMVKLPSLLQYLQEAAWKDAQALGFGYGNLREKGVAWALTRLSIELAGPIAWEDRLTIRTWSSGSDRVFCYRDFELATGTGLSVGRAASAWVVFDLASRRFVKPVVVSLDFGPARFWVRPPRLRLPENETLWDRVRVQYLDIDPNGHVNNATYAAWVANAVMLRYPLDTGALRIDINFIAEALWGQTIMVTGQREPNGAVTACIKGGTDGESLLSIHRLAPLAKR